MMARVNYSDYITIPNQIQVQRHNLIGVCRLVVKSLTDTANVMSVDESSDDLQNLFATLEQIFSHRIKPNITWYGGPEQRYFWDFMKVACTSVSRNCLMSVESMNLPKTSLGKGRAWMRMCLMEKRLSDYIHASLHAVKALESFYEEGSIMLCEEIAILPDILLGLNIIDFSFDIKGTRLDFPWMLAVNYSKYLKFDFSSHNEANQSSKVTQPSPLEEHSQVGEYANEVNSNKLMEQLKVTTEQKRYLDELLRLREFQIEDFAADRKRIHDVIEMEKLERSKERAQFESIIFELQSQLFHLREQTKGLVKKLQEKSRFESEAHHAGVLMSHLLTREVLEDARTNHGKDGTFPLAEDLRESYQQPTNEIEEFHRENKKELIGGRVKEDMLNEDVAEA